MTSKHENEKLNTSRDSIPDYIHGEMTTETQKAFVEAVAQDPELQQDLKIFKNVESVFKATEHLEDDHADHLFSRIRQNIQSENNTQKSESSGLKAREIQRDSWWNRLLNNTPLAWGFAFAQFALIAVLLIINVDEHEVTYGTLSGSAITQDSAARLNIVFNPSATLGEISGLLHETGTQLVNGPSKTGLIVVEIPDKQKNATLVLEQFRNSQLVQFAEIAI